MKHWLKMELVVLLFILLSAGKCNTESPDPTPTINISIKEATIQKFIPGMQELKPYYQVKITSQFELESLSLDSIKIKGKVRPVSVSMESDLNLIYARFQEDLAIQQDQVEGLLYYHYGEINGVYQIQSILTLPEVIMP